MTETEGTREETSKGKHGVVCAFCEDKCCSPLVNPVVRGAVDHGFNFRPFFLFTVLSFLSQHSLTTGSNSFYLLCCFPSFSDSFQISLNTVLPSQCWCSRLLSLHALGICSLCSFLIPYSFHITSQFLITFLYSNLHSNFINPSLISSLNTHDSHFVLCLFYVNSPYISCSYIH